MIFSSLVDPVKLLSHAVWREDLSATEESHPINFRPPRAQDMRRFWYIFSNPYNSCRISSAFWFKLSMMFLRRHLISIFHKRCDTLQLITCASSHICLQACNPAQVPVFIFLHTIHPEKTSLKIPYTNRPCCCLYIYGTNAGSSSPCTNLWYACYILQTLALHGSQGLFYLLKTLPMTGRYLSKCFWWAYTPLFSDVLLAKALVPSVHPRRLLWLLRTNSFRRRSRSVGQLIQPCHLEDAGERLRLLDLHNLKSLW